MDTYCIFIDESGWADLKASSQSPYFTICGIVIKDTNRVKLAQDWKKLKLKYFKKSDYILHKVDLRKDLGSKTKITSFSSELDRILKQHSFFLLLSIVDKKKAINFSWQNKTVYERSYRTIIGNLIKFLIAKNAIGKVHAEASNVQQDIFLYQSFFHYIANGIPALKIKPYDVKKHLTSVSFVTKTNNDPEEQIADLLGTCGRIASDIKNQRIIESSLDEIDLILYKTMKRTLFKGTTALKTSKIKLYKNIEAFAELP